MNKKLDAAARKAGWGWATRTICRAWGGAILAALAGACTAVVISEALLWRWFGAGGAWGGALFLKCLLFSIGAWAVLARYAFGKGSAAIHLKKLPPTWVLIVLAPLLFWAASWPIGLPPSSESKHVPRGVWITFTHGWVWLWGAIIAAGVAAAFWHALLPRLLARAKPEQPGKPLEPLPVEAGLAPTEQLMAVPPKRQVLPYMRNDLMRWLTENDGPLGPQEKPLFDLGLKPERIIQSLRPLHIFSPARTLALIGLRGSGKSTLLRLAEGSSAAKDGVTLKFAYISLWEYESASAAIRAVADEILAVAADHIDTTPFSSAAGALMRTVTGNERYWNIAAAFGLQPRTDELLGGLSTALLLARCRVILCIEDDDRISDEGKKQFRQTVTGCLDYLRRFPAFGYVICVSSKDWGSVFAAALDVIEPPDVRAARTNDVDGNIAFAKNGGVEGEKATGKIKEHQLKDVDVLRRARERAVADILDGLDTTRLCREELVIKPLEASQWQPVLESVRKMMFEHAGASADEKCFELSADDRRRVWDAFVQAASGSPFSTWRPVPASDPLGFAVAGITVTPRILRLGLSDAWRKWLAVVPMLGKDTVIDPDSVLVACLVRACRPDVWNTLIRDPNLPSGGEWPVTDYVVQSARRRRDAEIRWQEGLARAAGPRYHNSPIPHLDLQPAIKNLMLKQHDRPHPESRQPDPEAGEPQDGGEAADRKTTLTCMEPPTITRPGGLIGNIGGLDPGYNWRLFLNA